MNGVLAAWQAALAAEHAAVFGYGVAGPHLAGADVTAARQAAAAHESVRDRATAGLAALGQTPVPPAADYPLPFAVNAPDSARRLALRIEEATAAAWRYVIAVAAPEPGIDAGQVTALRADAQVALTGSAVRAVHWRRLLTPDSPTVPFPGT